MRGTGAAKHAASCTLTVRGRGGELLVWRFEGSTLTPWAEFETLGDDDVRVAGVGQEARSGEFRGGESPVWSVAFAVV